MSTDAFAPMARIQAVAMRRNATRELVQVNLKTKAKQQTWSVFGNHWPSRSGGQFESVGYRHIAGETLGYIHQWALEVHGADTPAGTVASALVPAAVLRFADVPKAAASPSRQRTTAGRPDRPSCLARIRSVRRYRSFVLATLIAVVRLLLVVAVVLLTGCSSESAKRGDGTVPEAAGTTDGKEIQKNAGSGIADTASLPAPRPLSAVPRRVLVSCNRSRLLRPACPRRLPAVDRYTSSLCPAGKRGCLFRERIDMFNVESLRSPHPKTGRPRFIHLVVYAGDLGGPKGFQTHAPSAFAFDWPDPSSARPLIDGLSPHRGLEALAFGRYRFGDVEGELVLAPAMQAMDGNHVIFRWRSGEREYAVSLHAWEPLTEAAATFRAIVAAVPAARR